MNHHSTEHAIQIPHASTRFRRTPLAATLGAALLLLGACGTSGATDSANSGESATATIASIAPETTDAESPEEDETAADSPTEEESILAYNNCMTDLGVNEQFLINPDLQGEEAESSQIIIGGDGEGGEAAITEEDFEVLQEAQKECDPILENAFGSFDLSPEQEAAQKDTELKWSRCMEEQGIDINISGGGFELSGDIDQAAMEEASEKCDGIFDELNDLFAEDDQ